IRGQRVTAPMPGPWDVVAWKLSVGRLESGVELAAIGDDPALWRCVGTQAAAARTVIVVVIGQFRRQPLDAARNTDLALQHFPPERRGRRWVRGQGRPLAAVVIRVKAEAVRPVALEQDNTG